MYPPRRGRVGSGLKSSSSLRSNPRPALLYLDVLLDCKPVVPSCIGVDSPLNTPSFSPIVQIYLNDLWRFKLITKQNAEIKGGLRMLEGSQLYRVITISSSYIKSLVVMSILVVMLLFIVLLLHCTVFLLMRGSHSAITINRVHTRVD